MTTTADIGDGAQFAIGTGSGPIVYTDVAEVVSIEPMEETREVVDATHLGSGGRREYIGGLRDGGEVSIEANFTAAGFTAMKAAYAANAPGPYRIAQGAAGAAPKTEFVGLVTSLKQGTIAPDETVMANMTIKLTGAAPTYTAA
jgi:hypothetical protein